MSVLVYLQIFGGDGLAPCLAGGVGRAWKPEQKFHFDATCNKHPYAHVPGAHTGVILILDTDFKHMLKN